MNFIRRILSLFPFAYAASGVAAPDQVSRVEIRDASFHLIRELTSDEEVGRFKEMWASKVKLTQSESKEAALGLTYKLDVSSGTRSTRWLYSPRGSVVVLSVFLSPIYQLPDPKAFNELVGALQP